MSTTFASSATEYRDLIRDLYSVAKDINSLHADMIAFDDRAEPADLTSVIDPIVQDIFTRISEAQRYNEEVVFYGGIQAFNFHTSGTDKLITATSDLAGSTLVTVEKPFQAIVDLLAESGVTTVTFEVIGAGSSSLNTTYTTDSSKTCTSNTLYVTYLPLPAVESTSNSPNIAFKVLSTA